MTKNMRETHLELQILPEYDFHNLNQHLLRSYCKFNNYILRNKKSSLIEGWIISYDYFAFKGNYQLGVKYKLKGYKFVNEIFD